MICVDLVLQSALQRGPNPAMAEVIDVLETLHRRHRTPGGHEKKINARPRSPAPIAVSNRHGCSELYDLRGRHQYQENIRSDILLSPNSAKLAARICHDTTMAWTNDRPLWV
jgi:hypothetical protein